MNVLILSDNVTQYEKVKSIIFQKNRKDINFVFKHSPIKSKMFDHPDFLSSQSNTIDVKKQVDEIAFNFHLVISMHCLQLFPKELINRVRCINIHPGYNPVNRGWYPQVFAIIHDLAIGATIHEMDEFLDNGPIIAREYVPSFSWDTSETIYNRVLEKELELFDKFFDNIIDNNYEQIKPEKYGNLFLKKDFNSLCEINLDKNVTYRDCINHLRALTHGDYLNAYYIDDVTKEKIYLKLDLIKK